MRGCGSLTTITNRYAIHLTLRKSDCHGILKKVRAIESFRDIFSSKRVKWGCGPTELVFEVVQVVNEMIT